MWSASRRKRRRKRRFGASLPNCLVYGQSSANAEQNEADK